MRTRLRHGHGRSRLGALFGLCIVPGLRPHLRSWLVARGSLSGMHSVSSNMSQCSSLGAPVRSPARSSQVHTITSRRCPGYSSALTRFQTGLDWYFRVQELAQELFNLAGYNLASLVWDLKVAGLNANIVLTAWAKEHPNEKLGYDDATLFATFFNWNSSRNLSAYLEKPEEIKKFQQFLKDHKLDSPSDSSTSGEAASDPVKTPIVEPKKTYLAMHASNWDAEAAAKPDEPPTPITGEQKP
ncbi:hypothetical protein F5880DRAFT_628213 [Lentinula raphanica]|nr:hypothetical protein F5880DRAFT_628213 [Lentinula raphanica]